MMKVRSRILAAIAFVCLLYLNAGSGAMAGTLLPNGEQYFTDNNGLPLSSGCVYFYVPGTLTPKATYIDSAQSTPNTNPVQLDASGRAIIYGTGTYRQIVKAAPCGSQGIQIWDQLTAATDTSNTIYAGASSGTPNAITVTAPAFSGTDGQVINYISTNTNTGGATINPSGFGAVQIVRDSATGPGALTGGELVATNAVSLIYDATAGTFHILSPVTWPNTSGTPVGTTIMVQGFNAPTNYAFTYGQAVSRTTYSALLAVLTSAQSGSISSGSPTITGLSDTSQLGASMPVEAVGIPANTTIVSCSGTSCTMSANATATRTGTMTFFAYGNGDGSTTFNLPDNRGQTFFARSNMGGSDPGILTATYCGSSPATLGHQCGSQSTTLVTGNLPPYTPSFSSPPALTLTANIKTGAFSGTDQANFLVVGNTAGTSLGTGGAWIASNSIAYTFAPQGGTSTPVSRVPPARIVNFAIRLVP